MMTNAVTRRPVASVPRSVYSSNADRAAHVDENLFQRDSEALSVRLSSHWVLGQVGYAVYELLDTLGSLRLLSTEQSRYLKASQKRFFLVLKLGKELS